MTWGYLSEFWSSITQVGDYTVQWFQNIGNAVAGAIGGFFEDMIHHIYDVFYFFQWLLENLGEMFLLAFSPLVWVFNFVRGFLTSASMSLEELGIELEEVNIYTENVENFFNTIPYFNYIISGITGCLGIFFLIYIIKQFKAI